MVEIIVGPPGTGKTTKLMNILKTELETVPPSRIALVTYTKAGVKEMVSRVAEKFNLTVDAMPYAKTLHALAFKELHMTKNKIMDWEDYKRLSKGTGKNFLGYYSEDLHHDDDRYLFFAELERNNPEAVKKYLQNYEKNVFEYVKASYQNYKSTWQKWDFTDMIEAFVVNDFSIDVDVAVIDEAQDLTTLQWKMAFQAFGKCPRIYIAGDDDQSIFQWAGADVKAFLSLEGQRTILNHSYRLPDNILAYSKRVSGRIKERIDKNYDGTGKDGRLEILPKLDSLSYDPNKTWLMVSRNNSYLKSYENFLQRQGLPYLFKGSPSIPEEDIALLRACLKLERKETLTEDEETLTSRKLKRNRLTEHWYNWVDWPVYKITYMLEYMKRFDIEKPVAYHNATGVPLIRVNSIHTSKGAEADNVVVLLDISKNVFDNYDVDPDAEHRVFYVAFTRAKENLFIIRSQSKYGYPLPGESM